MLVNTITNNAVAEIPGVRNGRKEGNNDRRKHMMENNGENVISAAIKLEDIRLELESKELGRADEVARWAGNLGFADRRAEDAIGLFRALIALTSTLCNATDNEKLQCASRMVGAYLMSGDNAIQPPSKEEQEEAAIIAEFKHVKPI